MSFSENKWSNAKLRVTEIAVFPNQDVFAHGHITITPDGTDLTLGKLSALKGNCFISTKGQGKLLKKLKTRKWVTFAVAVGLSAFLAFTSASKSASFTGEVFGFFFDLSGSIVRLLGLAIFLLFGSGFLKLFRTYNRFVRLREQVRLSRSAIDVTTKRRSSLIPELCNVIEGVMDHEKVVLQAVVDLRTQRSDLASKEILSLSESYPNIKSSTNFLNLQKELGRTEEKIAMARSFLNDSILAMDNLRATLFGMVFSPLFANEQRPNL